MPFLAFGPFLGGGGITEAEGEALGLALGTADATISADAEAQASSSADSEAISTTAADSTSSTSGEADATISAEAEAGATSSATAEGSVSGDAQGTAVSSADADATISADADAQATGTGEADATASSDAEAQATAVGEADATISADAESDGRSVGDIDPTANRDAEGEGQGQSSGEADVTITTAAESQAQATATGAATLSADAEASSQSTGQADATTAAGVAEADAQSQGDAEATITGEAEIAGSSSGDAVTFPFNTAESQATSEGQADATISATAEGTATSEGQAGTEAFAFPVRLGRDADVIAYPSLILRDDDQAEAVEEWLNAILYDLHVRVELHVQERAISRTDNPSARIGPSLNALYGQVLLTVTRNPSLGGVVDSIMESTFTADISTESYTTPIARGELELVVRYLDNGTPNRREQVLAAIVEALGANETLNVSTMREDMLSGLEAQLRAGLPGRTVHRNRRAKITRRVGQHVCLRDGDQEPSHDVTSLVAYEATPSLELTVWADTAAELPAAMESLYSDVRAALYADRTIGGAAFSLTDEALAIIENTATGSAPVLRAVLQLNVTYLTDEADPTRAAA